MDIAAPGEGRTAPLGRMNIVQLTPGAGAMYCGNCLRDNALVASLRQLGHQVLMIPLYLPLTLDEPDQSANIPVFFGGISVFLEQKFPWFRHAPAWLHRLLAARPLLRRAAGGAAKTRPDQAGELALSMLHGEEGKQARELDALIHWLKTQPKPDVICLSNALLLGSARRLETEFGAPVICMLQGEDSFLDGLPEPYRNACWKALAQRAAEIKLFIAPSRYFGELMLNRLGLPLDRLRVVFNGINLDGYEAPRQPATSLAPEASSRQQGRALSPKVPASASPSDAVLPQTEALAEATAPVIGYLARMCREKGLETLVDAFILLCRRARGQSVRLQVAGSCGPSDEPLVQELRERLSRAGLAGRADFHPNLTRSQKVAFLKSLTLFSVPANYGEAFGLYVIEAMAAGVPVVQPRTAAFPELLAATGGGLLCEPAEPESLAVTMEGLLLDLPLARKLGAQGRAAVFEKFSAAAMARGMIEAWSSVLGASEKTAPVGGRR